MGEPPYSSPFYNPQKIFLQAPIESRYEGSQARKFTPEIDYGVRSRPLQMGSSLSENSTGISRVSNK